MLAVEDVELISAPDFLRRMHVAVTVAVADPVAAPTTEIAPVHVFDAVELTVASPSTTVTAAEDVLDVTEIDADAIRTLVAVDVVDAVPAAIVSSGPSPK
jgi:hypothetical protein